MADNPTAVVIDGREYPLADSFNLGELADIEKITGQGYDLDQGGILGTLAMAYISVRRVDPRVTLDDLRNLTPDQFEIRGVDEIPPPQGASNGSAPTSSETSVPGSEPTPDETPAPTGTR